jgi:hypothetical protein
MHSLCSELSYLRYLPLEFLYLFNENNWVEFIAFPIGHAGTTLTGTLEHLSAAFSTGRPSVERLRASMDASSPATDNNARTHDYSLLKSLLDSLTDLAQSRLLGIIRNRKHLVDALPDGYRHQSHSDPSPTHH